MSATSESVAGFIAACESAGFSYSCKPGIVTVRRSFTPGNSAEFVRCDGDGPSLLDIVPTTSAGSTWGTDGGSVGGAVAIRDGHYRLNVSGVSKRFTTALAKA